MLKYMSETQTKLEYFTCLIQMHVDHRIELDMVCYRCMLNCIKPDLIEKIFDKNLLSADDQFHIGMAFFFDFQKVIFIKINFILLFHQQDACMVVS